MKVFVPMPDEGADAREFAGMRLVPYACGMAVLAMLGGAPAKPQVTDPALPAGSADRQP
jgi:hypothetical protein